MLVIHKHTSQTCSFRKLQVWLLLCLSPTPSNTLRDTSSSSPHPDATHRRRSQSEWRLPPAAPISTEVGNWLVPVLPVVKASAFGGLISFCSDRSCLQGLLCV